MAISNTASPEDQRSKICWLRSIFVASLVAATAVCSATVFLIIRKLEVDLGEQTFKSVATSALKGAQAISQRKVTVLRSMATAHAHIFPNASQWPFVAMPGFSEVVGLLANISSSVTAGVQVILKPDQVPDFEVFAAQTFEDLDYPESAGVSDFGFGVYAQDPSTNYPDGKIHDSDRNDSIPPKNDIVVPIFQFSDKYSKTILYNAYSESMRQDAIDSMLDCASNPQNLSSAPSCGLVTDFVVLLRRPGPAALFYMPIFPKNDPTILVGMMLTATHWVEVLTDVVPDYVDGLFCVISSPQSAKTFVINKGIPELIGEVCLIHR